MKKILYTLLGIAAVAATACQPKELAEPIPGARLVPLSIQAEQDATRTHIEAESNGWQPYWNEKDSIFVTLGSNLGEAFTFINTSGEGKTATFSGAIAEVEGQNTIYAFTPKKANRADSIFKFDLSGEQELTDLTTFDPRYDLLISDGVAVNVANGAANAEGSLHFHRMFAIAKVVVADGTSDSRLAGKKIKSVKLTSSTQILSGTIRVHIGDATHATIEGVESGTKRNFVGATYAGDDWAIDGTTGGFLLVNPCVLESGSDIILEATTDDANLSVRHKATLTSNLTLESGVIPTLKFTVKDADFAAVNTWDFGSAEWQAAFEAQAPGAKDTKASNWTTSLNGLTYTSGKDDRWSVNGYVQPNGAGSTSNRCFTFTAPADGTVEVRASGTGKDGNAGRNIVVNCGGSESSQEVGSAPSTSPVTKSFDVKAGKVIIYPDASVRIYSISYIGAAVGGTDTPGGGDNPVDPQPGEEGSWDFSESAWQTSFATYGAAASTDPLSNYDNTIAGLTVKAEAFKYGSTYFQMAKAGSNQANYFKFTVAEAGVVSVVASHTGSTLPKSDRYCTVYNNSTTASVVASVSSKSPKTCNFNVAAGDVYVYTTSENVSDGVGMRFYKIYFTAGASVDPENPVLPDEAQGELEIPAGQKPTEGAVELDKMYGFAQAAGVTGGDAASSANILHFDNGKALQTWLLARAKSEKKGDHSPVTIWLSGTFKPDDGRDFSEAHPWFDVKEVSNLSIYGTDGFVMDRIGIFCVRASNIIIRNINFQQPKANNGADAVSMQESDGVWVDHCTFTSLNQTKDYEDGSTDITHGSKNVTVSWCRYIKTQKSCLVGHSNSQSGDVSITATFHHNWFDGSSSRHPRVRFGWAHVYNNLFDGCTTYGVGSAYGAKVLVEYNYFDGVQLPTDICTYPAKESNESNLQGSVAGYLFAGGDVLVNRPGKAKDPYPLTNLKYKSYNGETLSTPLTYADFKPGYSYVVTPAENVPEVVKAGAGYGKLGWAEAPVAVNNGGVNPSEYNGTDEDPTDPDPGSGEEPGTPAAGLSEGWNWVNNNATTATYAVSDGKLNIASTGKWESKAQGFGFAYREVTGDFTATVELVSYEPLKNSNQAVAGLMAVDGSVSATATDLLFAMGGNVYGNARTATGKDKGGFSIKQPEATGGKTILRLKREGDVLKVSLSLDGGATFGEASSKDFSVDGGGTGLSETLKVGLACNSGDNSKQSTAVFANFTINDTVIAF